MKAVFLSAAMLAFACCTPTPAPSPVLAALADQSLRGALVAEIPGEPVGSISLVADTDGLSLYASVYDGPDRRAWKRARSSDGIRFEEAEEVTPPDDRADLFDVVRDGDVVRALWFGSDSKLRSASSADGLTFVDDGLVEVGDGTFIPFGARLVTPLTNGSAGEFHLYFTEDRSTGCTDTICARAAISHGASAILDRFQTIQAVAEDAPQSDPCAACGEDYWQLGGVVRSAAPSCVSDGPILLALRAVAEAAWVAIALESDGATTHASVPLEGAVPIVRVGMSQTAVFARDTIAIYSATCACSGPPVTTVTLDVVLAPADAQIRCQP